MNKTKLLLAGGLAAASLALALPPAPGFKLIAWNDLGMHCMDADYSVFSILPPFNNLHAQLIDGSGRLVRAAGGFTVTYEAVADPGGSINRSSAGKTNYWSFADVLYGGSKTPDTGLAGHNMPGPQNQPQAMAFAPATATFHAEGIPITPYDDARHKRPYPMMRVVARDANQIERASTQVVLPVSDEMDCSLCHASGSPTPARPAGGWVYEPDHQRDYRLNILRRHDDNHAGTVIYQQALATAGYLAAGLEATVRQAGKPILCAKCHASNALPGTGLPGISALTAAMHASHAVVVDPRNGLRLEDVVNRSACYVCHPGSETRCLRGAMGAAVASNGALAIQCQNCHGSMSKVGNALRTGWLDQPACQACHTGTAVLNNGQIRYTDAFDPSTGKLRVARDQTFATDPDVPAPGFSLYRFSYGHGDLNCEACHGSTHAEYPATHANDNVQSITLQGHAGTLSECLACHVTEPRTATGGPHGLHTVGQWWVDEHGDHVELNGSLGCRNCHGTDYRGTVLAVVAATRSYATKYGTKTFAEGSQVSCYACHRGPSNGDPSTNGRPVAQDGTATAVDVPVSVTLVATDPDANPLTFKIVQQPEHGRVGVNGNLATYHPDPGFAGQDTFTFLAWDGSVHSNTGTVRVTRGATWGNYGAGYPGTAAVVPELTLSGRPVLGTVVGLKLGNPAGVATAGVLVLSEERANLGTGVGGALLVEPTLALALGVPAQGALIGFAIPNDPALVGLGLQMQGAVADTGARFLVAFTRGLTLNPGR
ncbi:MAG: hypothetical protein IT458_05275 [Planctomycetes bacterium]|nr:hypothetical protein [Planctomycetota bacterium]